MPATRLQTLLFALLPSVAAAGIFALGVWAGRHYAGRPFRDQLGQWSDAATLGAMADARGIRDQVALAYKDPAAAVAGMGHYTWVPENTPVPFLGSAPAPGRSRRWTRRGSVALSDSSPPASRRVPAARRQRPPAPGRPPG